MISKTSGGRDPGGGGMVVEVVDPAVVVVVVPSGVVVVVPPGVVVEVFVAKLGDRWHIGQQG